MRRTALLLVGIGLWRLLYAAIVPLDLAPDEAYYWNWSRELDCGYCSKPCLAAWLIALSRRTLGSAPFTVRLPDVLASASRSLDPLPAVTLPPEEGSQHSYAPFLGRDLATWSE